MFSQRRFDNHRVAALEQVLTYSQIDSLVPGYSCPRADAIRNAYQSVPAWTDHLHQNVDLKARLDAVFGTAGRSDWASWCAFLACERKDTVLTRRVQMTTSSM